MANWTRRDFLSVTGIALASTSLPLAAAPPPSEKLNIGVIGVTGRGIDNLAGVASENVAALCDVDERLLGESALLYPKARKFRDFRQMIDADDLDAVIVASPDHTHAVAAVHAMRRGLSVYCEKPLAHDLRETELMVRVAAETKVTTQMGNQHHGSAGYRRVVQLLRASVLGEVKEVHAWTVRPIWPQGIARPQATPRVPETLDWDLWLGPAPERPYHWAYHPRDWRGWWDFGTGALGDFLPHIFDPVYEGLQLTAPTRIAANCAEVNRETLPKWSQVQFAFPQRNELPTVKVHWYDGGKQPTPKITGVERLPNNGALVIGAQGKLFIPSHGKPPIVMANKKGERLELPDALEHKERTHWEEWIAACKSGEPTSSDFAYGARLTDVALLGNLAIRTGAAIEWNADERRVTNVDAANEFLGREYREGWKVS